MAVICRLIYWFISCLLPSSCAVRQNSSISWDATGRISLKYGTYVNKKNLDKIQIWFKTGKYIWHFT